MAVSFDELVGSPTYSGSRDSINATRRGLIDWDDVDTHYAEMFPSPILGIPQLPALLPGSSVLFADSVTYKPQHDDGDQDCSATLASYTKAEVEIQYSGIPYHQSDPSSDQIITRRLTLGAEFLTLKNHGLRWVGESESIPDTEFDPGKLCPTLEISITLHRVTAAYYSSLRTICNSLIGKVNSAYFEGFSAGTLLFLGAGFTESVSTVSTSWQTELQFKQRLIKSGGQAVGWNYAFDPEAGSWRQIETTNGDAIYPAANFNQFY